MGGGVRTGAAGWWIINLPAGPWRDIAWSFDVKALIGSGVSKCYKFCFWQVFWSVFAFGIRCFWYVIVGDSRLQFQNLLSGLETTLMETWFILCLFIITFDMIWKCSLRCQYIIFSYDFHSRNIPYFTNVRTLFLSCLSFPQQ